MKIVFHSNKLRLFKSVGRKIVISLAAFVLRLIPRVSSNSLVFCVVNDINAHKKDSKSLAVPLFCLIFAMLLKRWCPACLMAAVSEIIHIEPVRIMPTLGF